MHKAVQEILLSLCFDIISEIGNKKLLSPIEAIRKWIAKDRYFDTLMGYMQRLMGKYVEIQEEQRKPKKGARLSFMAVELNYEQETEIRKGRTAAEKKSKI